MKAVRTLDSNLTLTLDGAGPDRNLPAQQIRAYDPERGETPDDAKPAIETVWMPDDGERRALVNGAPVELVVTGRRHPPVSMKVGEPKPELAGGLVALLAADHVDRAVGYLFSKLSDTLADDGAAFPDAEGCLTIWQEALEATKEGQPLDLGAKLDEVRELAGEPPSGDPEKRGPNGNGDVAA